MDDAIDRQVRRGYRAGDRIDQKRHVIIDDGEPHPPLCRAAGHGFERDGRLARNACQRSAGNEQRRGIPGVGATILILVGQRAVAQRGANIGQHRGGYRLRLGDGLGR